MICGNCLNAINNVSACSVLFLSTPWLFPALRKTLESTACSEIFLRAGNNPVVFKNSSEHAETLFIALMDFDEYLAKGSFFRSISKNCFLTVYI